MKSFTYGTVECVLFTVTRTRSQQAVMTSRRLLYQCVQAFTFISGLSFHLSLKPPLLALPNKYVTYVEVAFDMIMKNRNMRVSFVARPPRYEKVSRHFHAPKYADPLLLLLLRV